MGFYDEAINEPSFDALLPVLSTDVVFWFGSGSFCGISAERLAFERTWQRIAEETYWLEDLSWVPEGDLSAVCIYQFHWRGVVDGEPRVGTGRGTSVLRREADGWKLVHEHLSAEPVHGD